MQTQVRQTVFHYKGSPITASALTGPIAAFNEIIGCTIDDPKVSQIASDVGAAYTVWEDKEIPGIHWNFEGKGLEFCFDDEILTAIFFHFDFREDGLHKITLLLEPP